jgi:crotonobetainyl-CoA:carnitine CoA-transferase CaiB-like acyl-CoA transferase
MSVTGPAPGQPVKTGVALVDVLTGLHAAVGILAALRERETSGEGQRVEVNLLSCLLSSMVNQSAGYTMGGVVPGIMGNRHPSIAPYEVFATADVPMVLAVGNDRQFARLWSALELPTRLGLSPTVPLDGLDVVANPIGLSRTPPEYRRRPPRLGEHNEELS